MAQLEATNTFTSGLMMDTTDLALANTALTNALNATLLTFNGNEMTLQNDMGNAKIITKDGTALLTEGFIAVGVVEYGGILYISSYNPITSECEIGSFPSPDYSVTAGTNAPMKWVYEPLHIALPDDSNNVGSVFRTTLLGFDLRHQVNMLAEQSFDNSVNLILNDYTNLPRLINTGFHALANNTATIIKRIGSNNTNRYDLTDETSFKLETSLYKDTALISNFTFKGLEIGGLLKVGNYTFYAIVCDKDLNESDMICESGVVSVFKGTDGDPFSVQGGVENESTDKSVHLIVSPIDDCYNYIKICYTRTSAANNQTAATLAYKIDKLFPITTLKDGTRGCDIIISGYETTEDITVADLNISYFNADIAKAQAISLNMLFLANVVEKDQDPLEYETLRNYSLNIIPSLDLSKEVSLLSDYSNATDSYYNSLFIYDYTGYHFGEIYRFGIVYIRQDNSLTSVFDICGVRELTTTVNIPVVPIPSEVNFYFESGSECTDEISTYNTKGVCRIMDGMNYKLTTVVGIKFNLPNDFLSKLKNTYKGYFFVRLKRIPTMLALGYATNICEESFLPSINIPNIVNKIDDVENKLYLYESFVTGGFLNNSSDNETTNFYPKRTTGKHVSKILTNNYRSRLFTLSNYTWLYLDKNIGNGPVSAFINTVQVEKALFMAPGYEEFIVKETKYPYFNTSTKKLTDGTSVPTETITIVESGNSYTVYKVDDGIVDSEGYYVSRETESEQKDGSVRLARINVEIPYVGVYYPTPEKWDDHGCSDHSSGRTLLRDEDSDGDMNLYIHIFRRTVGVASKDLVNITLDTTTGTKDDDMTVTSYEDDLTKPLYATDADGNYVTDENGDYIIIGYESKTVTSTKSDLVEHIGMSVNQIANYAVEWEKEPSLGSDDGITGSRVERFWNRWYGSLETKGAETCYETGFTNSNCSGDHWGWGKYKTPINASGMGTTKTSPYIVSTASNKGSYKYTDIGGMVLAQEKTHNAGLGLSFYVNTNHPTTGEIYFSPDGSTFYTPWADFFGHSNKWSIAIANLLKAIYAYIGVFEKASDESSDSALKEDPTTPTFDGKYGQTESTTEDQYRIKLNPMEYGAFGVFCPEYELNQPYYNNIFTGLKLKVQSITKQLLLKILNNFKTRLYIYDNTTITNSDIADCNGISVSDSITLLSTLHNITYTEDEDYWPRPKLSYFSSKIGNNTEISFGYAGGKAISHVYYKKFNDLRLDLGKSYLKAPYNLVRGAYGPYVGLSTYKESTKAGEEIWEAPDIADTIVSLYVPGYSLNNLKNYFELRLSDSSVYYAISDRFNIEQNPNICYRGDCYINFYTHRINRNFNDATSLYNDTIIDGMSFLTGFKGCFDYEYRTFDLTKDAEAAKAFNVGDLNAILLGSWVTFPIRSTMNTALRCDDSSYVNEVLACGHNRTFYPLYALDAGGSNKIPESESFNAGYNKSGSERQYTNLNQDVFVKTYYKNRICYSNILQANSLLNGHRIFISTHYKDYTDLYGEIVKLIDLSGNLLVICEHGLLLIPINERALAGEGSGGFVYINTSNVLPDNPKVLSDTYGTTWPSSVIQTPYGVYGIDERSKKIWKTDGSTITLISDTKVQQFLNKALQISDTINIGTTNIQTYYNQYKNDVMFTLYDFNEDRFWNLCFNENLSTNGNGFLTFYSWIPVLGENIGNNFVTCNLMDANKSLTTSTLTLLWKHGLSERIPTSDRIKPTSWYDEQHPFEFEFVVLDNPIYHKIFDNLQIISNKAKPESFHYEIVGESYDFYKDKATIYKRQELLKKMYLKLLGSNISYDSNADNLKAILSKKSAAFPLYYYRQDIINLIYDNYKQITCTGYDYDALAGCEVVNYPELNEFRLCNHVKGVDVRDSGGLLRGNMNYVEDKWKIQITPINLVYKNETWNTYNGEPKVPIALMTLKSNEPNLKDLITEASLAANFPGYTFDDFNSWNISNRQEIKIKDKYVKIKIRYTGDELAIISAIKTLYTISYA